MLEKDMWQILKKSLKNKDEIKLYRLEVSTVRGIPDIVFHYQINSCWVTGWIESKQLFKDYKTDAWLSEYISMDACHLSVPQLEFLLRAPNSYLYLSFPTGDLKLIAFSTFSEMCLNNKITWRSFLLSGFSNASASNEHKTDYFSTVIDFGSKHYRANSLLRFALSDE